VALTLFGGHDLRQAGTTLQIAVHQVVRCILEAILFGISASLPPDRDPRQQAAGDGVAQLREGGTAVDPALHQ
jgi:hypothetical protein